jgi:predicted Zn-dependent protease
MDPSGLERLLGALAADEGKLGAAMSFVSTHPASAERVRALSEWRRSSTPPPIAPLTADWAAAKRECAPSRVSDPDAG